MVETPRQLKVISVFSLTDALVAAITSLIGARNCIHVVSKASNLRKLTSRIGIHSVYVIHLVGDVTDPDYEVVDQSIEKLWDAMAEHLLLRTAQAPASIRPRATCGLKTST